MEGAVRSVKFRAISEKLWKPKLATSWVIFMNLFIFIEISPN